MRAAIFAGTLWLIAPVFARAAALLPNLGPMSADPGAPPATETGGGSYFFAQDLGTMLRVSYDTESYGQDMESGDLDIGTMQMFNFDDSAVFFDGQVTLNDPNGVGFNIGVETVHQGFTFAAAYDQPTEEATLSAARTFDVHGHAIDAKYEVTLSRDSDKPMSHELSASTTTDLIPYVPGVGFEAKLTAEGKELIDHEEISATRDISFDEAQLLAKEREQEILREALARDLVALVMRRLAAL